MLILAIIVAALAIITLGVGLFGRFTKQVPDPDNSDRYVTRHVKVRSTGPNKVLIQR